MRSPEPIQPPMTPPTRPSSSAVSAPRAALRAAIAAAGLSTRGAACGAQAGGAASPPYHVPRKPPAPSAAKNSRPGMVTSQTMAPWSMAVSARRVPATRATTQPPRTNERNEPNTLNASVVRRNSCQLAMRWPSWWTPTAMPVKPNTSNRAMADSAPTQIPLQDTSQGRSPSTCSTLTTSSTSSLAIGPFPSGFPPRLTFPVLRAAEVVVQKLFVLTTQRHARIELGSGLDVSLRQVHVDPGILPAHALDPFRRDQHLAARQPVPRVDDEVADGPRLVVDEKVFHVAEVAVGRLDVVAHHVARAAEIGVHALTLAGEHLLFDLVRLQRCDRHAGVREVGGARVRDLTPAERSDPVIGIAVVPGVIDLQIPVDGPIGVDRRAVLDLILRQRRLQPRGTGDRAEREGRDEHLPAGQPRAGLDDVVANRPRVVVEVKVLRAADVAVGRLDRDSLELACRSEHLGLLLRALRCAVSGALSVKLRRYFTRAGAHSCSCLRSSSCELNFLRSDCT